MCYNPAMSVTPNSPSFVIRAFAYVRLMHAGPVTAVMTATLLFALVAAGGLPPLGLLLRTLLVVFFSQYAIGALNEYRDRELDAAANRPKPIVQGLVPARVAFILALVSYGLMAVLAATFGLLMFALVVAAGTSGMLYNLGLKQTPFSWLPYFVSFPLLPIWVRAAIVGRFDAGSLWLIPILGAMVIGLHLGNSLPDVELDTAQGSHSLSVTLGLQRGLLVAWGSFAVAQAIGLIVLLTPAYEKQRPLLLLAEGVSALALIGAILTYRLRPSREGRISMFYVLGVSAVSLVLGWLLVVG